MQADFTGKRVLVTGGSRGIGRAAVAAFLKAGARVAANGRTIDSTAAGMADIGVDGESERLLAAPGDVATAAGCEAMVGAAIEGLGGLDVLVNSAGIGKDGTIEDFDEAAWNETLDVNLKGTFFCIRTALTALRANRGNVVNVASDAGLMGQVGLIVYGASKGGVVNMTRAMALELAGKNIYVNAVAPGPIMTEGMRELIERVPSVHESRVRDVPMGRFGTPEEMAEICLFLASEKCSYMNGSVLVADGGFLTH